MSPPVPEEGTRVYLENCIEKKFAEKKKKHHKLKSRGNGDVTTATISKA